MAKQITNTTKDIALHILTNAFLENPNLNWMARKPDHKHIRNICLYCLEQAMIKKGAYISQDNRGVLLAYPNTPLASFRNKCRHMLAYIKLLFRSIRIGRIPKILSLRREIRRITPDKKHLYCLMISNDKDSNRISSIAELKNFLFALSEKMNLPIYVQTSLPRNKRLFERYGFDHYATCVKDYTPFKLWLLKTTI